MIFAGFLVCLPALLSTLFAPALPLQARVKPVSVGEAPAGQVEKQPRDSDLRPELT